MFIVYCVELKWIGNIMYKSFDNPNSVEFHSMPLSVNISKLYMTWEPSKDHMKSITGVKSSVLLGFWGMKLDLTVLIRL